MAGKHHACGTVVDAFDGIKSGLQVFVSSGVLTGKPLHSFPDALY